MGRFLAALGTLLLLAVSGQAFAQSVPPQLPLRSAVDANGVDVLGKRLMYDLLGVSIGTPGAGQLSATVNSSGKTQYAGEAYSFGGVTYVNLGGSSVGFTHDILADHTLDPRSMAVGFLKR